MIIGCAYSRLRPQTPGHEAPPAKFTVLRPVIGGIAFGLVGVALPLTLFTGTDQLTTVIEDGAALGPVS